MKKKAKNVFFTSITSDHDVLYGLTKKGEVYVYLRDNRMEMAMFGNVKSKWGWRKLSTQEI